MATNRNTPQHSIALYPELARLTEKAEGVLGKPKSRLLYDACVRGLRESLREIEQNLVTIEYECSPDEAAYFYNLVKQSGMTQSEFLRRLIYDYSDQLVAKERGEDTQAATEAWNRKKKNYSDSTEAIHDRWMKAFDNVQSGYGEVFEALANDDQEQLELPLAVPQDRIRQPGFVPGNYDIIESHSPEVPIGDL